MPSLKNNAFAFAALFAYAQAQQVLTQTAGEKKIAGLKDVIPTDPTQQKEVCDMVPGNLVDGNCYTFGDVVAWSVDGQTTAGACAGGCASWSVCVDDAETCKAGEASGIGMIIAIVAGLLCAVVAAILIYCMCCKNNKDDEFARQ